MGEEARFGPKRGQAEQMKTVFKGVKHYHRLFGGLTGRGFRGRKKKKKNSLLHNLKEKFKLVSSPS